MLICWLIIVLRPFPATAGGLVPLEPGALMSWAWLCNNTWHLLKRYLLSKRISGEAIVLHCFVLFFFSRLDVFIEFHSFTVVYIAETRQCIDSFSPFGMYIN